jgi:single-stranded-DNA-specific exonuclease
VIGIVASRLVERFHRPVVLVAPSTAGWKGSGRSIPEFDLHGGLAACAGHLEAFGGHRAAAGLAITEAQLEPFTEAFARHADTALAEIDPRPLTVVDAIVPASGLTLELAHELERLAPFGLGNPEPTLLVASIEAATPATVGDGRHLRFRVRQLGRDGGSAIAFGFGAALERVQQDGRRFDLAFRLQQNRWNGTVAPQLVVRRLFDAPDTYEDLRAWLVEEWRSDEAQRSPEARKIFAELALGGGAARRELLESDTFRAMLDRHETALPEAA